MTERKNVYFADEIFALLDLDEGDRLSERVNYLIGAYYTMIADSMPLFSRGEWCAIMDANNGTLYDHILPSMLWANLHDSPGMSAKWDIDQGDLVKQLQSLSRSQLLAVQEAINGFWRHHELPTDEALQRAGAKIIESGET